MVIYLSIYCLRAAMNIQNCRIRFVWVIVSRLQNPAIQFHIPLQNITRHTRPHILFSKIRLIKVCQQTAILTMQITYIQFLQPHILHTDEIHLILSKRNGVNTSLRIIYRSNFSPVIQCINCTSVKQGCNKIHSILIQTDTCSATIAAIASHTGACRILIGSQQTYLSRIRM